MELADYNNQFGDIDLFLLDLLLKGHIKDGADVLDAGCGAGRNAFFFLKNGHNVKAIDRQKSEVNAINLMSRSFGKGDVALLGELSHLPYEDRSFDLIVCSRVLHFAESNEKYKEILSELYRVLRPSGILYISMNSRIGLSQKEDMKVRSNSGSNALLLTSAMVAEIEATWNKLMANRTVLFDQGQSETTLVLQKV
jgi:tellurite methyltransferase